MIEIEHNDDYNNIILKLNVYVKNKLYNKMLETSLSK